MFARPLGLVIVDDEAELAELLQESIEDHFPKMFKIRCFQDPHAALEFIKNSSTMIVFTDVRMPDVNGDHLNLQIKQLGRGIQTIIVTGYHNYSTTVTCFRDGANGYITKPFQESIIRKTLQRIIDTLDDWDIVFSEYGRKAAY